MADKWKKTSAIVLDKLIGKKIHVKFVGGREIEGILQGSDSLLNIVTDETLEYLRDVNDPLKITSQTRSLGLVISRGNAVISICPSDTMEPVDNPFSTEETVE